MKRPVFAFILLILLSALFICAGSFCTGGTAGGPDSASIEASEGSGIADEGATRLYLPLLGDIDARDYSLPVLAVLLGLVDGFNPCAMWALVYLISLVAGLNDRTKIWLVVGTFVASSGILYFLFMSAWLNAFLFLGFFRPVTLVIGLLSLYVGVGNIISTIRKRGAVECEVVDGATRRQTMNRMKKVLASPVTLTSLVSVVGLAFIVNSMEFVCSCAIPAVFTHVLAMSNLSTIEHYGYILLYVSFFMLDDFIIFGSAVFAFNATLGSRYLVYCKVIGGLLLIALGFFLVFMPHVLLMR